jgi:hypothetical protein
MMMMILPREKEGKEDENVNDLKLERVLLLMMFRPRERTRGRESFLGLVIPGNRNREMKGLHSSPVLK